MHERILAEFQAAGAGTIDHPKERYVTQPVVRVATSDIGVNSRKPDLFHMLIFCAFLRLPQCRLERSSVLLLKLTGSLPKLSPWITKLHRELMSFRLVEALASPACF
jgi:hypothetical protein